MCPRAGRVPEQQQQMGGGREHQRARAVGVGALGGARGARVPRGARALRGRRLHDPRRVHATRAPLLWLLGVLLLGLKIEIQMNIDINFD